MNVPLSDTELFKPRAACLCFCLCLCLCLCLCACVCASVSERCRVYCYLRLLRPSPSPSLSLFYVVVIVQQLHSVQLSFKKCTVWKFAALIGLKSVLPARCPTDATLCCCRRRCCYCYCWERLRLRLRRRRRRAIIVGKLYARERFDALRLSVTSFVVVRCC